MNNINVIPMEFTDKDREICRKYDEDVKAGKMSWTEYGYDLDFMFWLLDRTDEEQEKYLDYVEYDKYNNPTYHYTCVVLP